MPFSSFEMLEEALLELTDKMESILETTVEILNKSDSVEDFISSPGKLSNLGGLICLYHQFFIKCKIKNLSELEEIFEKFYSEVTVQHAVAGMFFTFISLCMSLYSTYIRLRLY